MIDRKSIPVLLVVSMIGLVLGMTVAGGDTVIVGLNHWSHNKTLGFLFPTNTTLDVNLSGNELLDANLSIYAGDDISWDDVDMEFDVTGNGSSKWNRDAGIGMLYTKINGDDVQINGSLTVVGDVTAGAFYGDGSGLTNVNGSNISGGLWTRDSGLGVLYTGVDGDDVQVNGTVKADALQSPTLWSGTNTWQATTNGFGWYVVDATRSSSFVNPEGTFTIQLPAPFGDTIDISGTGGVVTDLRFNNDVQITGSLAVGGNLDMDSNDIDNAFDIECENDLTVSNDIYLQDVLYHKGDLDTYMNINTNQFDFFAGGVNVLDMESDEIEIAVDTIFEKNITVDGFVLSDLLPSPSLTHDLGSGANRWNFIYVADVNCENIEVSEDIVVLTGNVTAGAFYGDGHGLDNINGSNITGALSLENVSMNNITEYNDYGIHFLDAVNITKNLTVDGTILFPNGIIVGNAVTTSSGDGIAIGNDALSEGDKIAIGYGANAAPGIPLGNQVVIGKDATGANAGVCIGGDATTSNVQGVAVGESSYTSQYATAIGYDTNSTGIYSITLGHSAVSVGSGGVSIGSLAYSGQNAFALAYQANASGVGSMAFGADSHAIAESSVALGQNAIANEPYTITTPLNASFEGDTVNITGNLTVGVDGTGHDVIFYGDTATRMLKWDQATDSLRLVNSGSAVGSKLLFYNGAVEKGSIYNYEALAASTKGLYFTSSSNMHFQANGGAGDIRFTAQDVILTDDVSLSLGTGSLGTPDFKIFFRSSDSTVQFQPQTPGIGSPPAAVVFNELSKNTDFRVNTTQGNSFFVDGATGDVNILGELNMTGNNINDTKTVFFTDVMGSTFGVDPEFPGYFGAGNVLGKFWLPATGDKQYYVGYDLLERVDFTFGDGCKMDVTLGGSVSGSNQYVRFKQSMWGVNSVLGKYYLQNFTQDEELNMKIYQHGPGKSDAEFNLNTESTLATFQDVVLRLQSINTANIDSVNLTYDASEDELIISDANVTINENLTVAENITGNFFHGEAFFHDHDGVVLTFVADIWYNLSFDAATNLNGFTWDGDGNLTCLVSGLYKVGFVACGSGQNNHVYHLAVGLNGVANTSLSAHKKMAAGGDETDMGGSGFISLSAGDYVSLMIRDHGGAGAGKYIHSNLNLVRIGD